MLSCLQKRVNKLLKSYPKIKDALGKKWINKNLFSANKPYIHPLMQILLDENRNYIFFDGLKLLQKKYPKFKNLIKTVKKASKFDDLQAIYTEVQLFKYFFAKKGISNCTFRPPLTTGQEGDLEFNFKGNKIGLEIFTVVDDQISSQQDKIDYDLRSKINKLIVNTCISVSLHFKIRISERMANLIFNEAKKFLNKEMGGERCEIPVKEGDCLIAILKFEKNDKNKKGCCYGSTGPGRSLNTGRRIKSKLLDKIEKMQFSQDVDIKGFILHLDTLNEDYFNFCNAILGQSYLNFNPRNKKYEHGKVRQKNGIIHHEDFKDGKIDFIMAYKNNKINDNHTILINNLHKKTVHQLLFHDMKNSAKTVKISLK